MCPGSPSQNTFDAISRTPAASLTFFPLAITITWLDVVPAAERGPDALAGGSAAAHCR
ncbi:hypothetical protein [Amycolatopsis sp. NPDC059657]|uniref:hypothetical protein n=1 Tax=Amycolatopsis sp. NPDC059657 TaxID=3346899 RepID=UPI0036701CF4